MKMSRRNLFGLTAGAAGATVVPAPARAAKDTLSQAMADLAEQMDRDFKSSLWTPSKSPGYRRGEVLTFHKLDGSIERIKVV